MKVFVTGAAGQLGHDVMNELHKRGYEGIGSDLKPEYAGVQDGSPVTGMPYVGLDITDEEAVHRVIRELAPDVIVHCAAWDYVFNGLGTKPWDPDCKDYAPLNVYGRSKLAGELAVSSTLEKYFIVRIAWVFGKSGQNFIKTMLKLSETHDTLRVVKDQVGTPTYTYDLARLLVDMMETDKYGYYHATNEGGYISWYDFACEIFRQAGKNVTVIPVTTEEYGKSVAARPMNSRLDRSKLRREGFEPLPAWQDALSRYLKEIGE